MVKTVSTKPFVSVPPQDRLYAESAKIRSIAYLIENQRDARAVPLDFEDINVGLGLILSEAAANIHDLAVDLDANEIQERQRRKR